jgi:2-hydroxy-3-keto-5-methylthiopentenyl-1-phosphate phosphatase
MISSNVATLDRPNRHRNGGILDLGDRPTVVFCDFDGTVTTSDVTDVLLQQLAHPSWQEIEERWLSGDIDDCQCMAQQIALIDGAWANIVKVVDSSIAIDPHFKSFMTLCNDMRIPVYIGSNGLDRIITHILNRESIQVAGYWAYRLVEKHKSWSLEFPQGEKRGKCKTPHSIACKCALLERKLTDKEPYKIVIGDSKSDFCWSTKADFVFAKSKLAQYCREQDIDHQTFVDFSHISECLAQKIAA